MSDTTTGGTVNHKTAKIDLRLTPDQRAALQTLAAQRGRSLGAEVRAALDAWLERRAET